MNHYLISLSLLSMVTVSSCASQPKIDTLEAEQSLAIKTPMDMPALNYVHISNKAAEEVSRSITSDAALSGATLTGLTCGSMFLLCAPIGLATGALVGSSMGETVGHALNLDVTSRQLISKKIHAQVNKVSIHEQLAETLRAAAARHYKIDDQNATNQLRIQIIRLQLNSHASAGVALEMTVHINLTQFKVPDEPIHSDQTIHYTSMVLPVERWLNGDEAFYQLMFTSAYNGLSEMVLSHLVGDYQSRFDFRGNIR